MAEYIEREAALALAKDICVLTKWDAEYRHRSIDPLDVMELPAADVRPVVLCRDCKHYRLDPIEIGQMVCVKDADEVDGYFSGFLSYPSETWFCADGAKKEES